MTSESKPKSITRADVKATLGALVLLDEKYGQGTLPLVPHFAVLRAAREFVAAHREWERSRGLR